MLSWIIIVLGLWGSFTYSDLKSQSVLYHTVCPVLAVAFLIALAIKVVLLGRGGKGSSFSDGSSSSSSDGFWSFGDSSDSGSSGGSCGGGGGD